MTPTNFASGPKNRAIRKIRVGPGVTLPNKPLDNFELASAAKKLHLPKFRGVYTRDALPSKPWRRENGILNLDNGLGGGTHWTAWYKSGDRKVYFDSFGVGPPNELVDYLGEPVSYNTEQVQPRDQVFCGHLCLYVLKELVKGRQPQEVVNDLF